MRLELENVSYVYAPKSPYEFKALDEVSLKIKPGAITAIIGSTGGGKSTLIQHLNGLLIPSSGDVYVGQYHIKSKVKKIKKIKNLRRQIGLVFQFAEYQLFEDTVEKDIIFGPVNLGISKEVALKTCKKYLDLVGLPERFLSSSPFELSGGQKRRVAIAGILAIETEVLIFDEPTAGLDPAGEADIINLIKSLNKDHNKTIILVTHNMNHVLQIADDVVVLNKSKIISRGTPKQVFSNIELMNKCDLVLPEVYKIATILSEKGLLAFDNFDAKTLPELVDFLSNKVLKKGK